MAPVSASRTPSGNRNCGNHQATKPSTPTTTLTPPSRVSVSFRSKKPVFFRCFLFVFFAFSAFFVISAASCLAASCRACSIISPREGSTTAACSRRVRPPIASSWSFDSDGSLSALRLNVPDSGAGRLSHRAVEVGIAFKRSAPCVRDRD